MTSTLVERAAALLERHDRRGFLRRTAVAGSAMVVAPKAFALTPTSAYAAVCSCSGYSCNCGSTCCDGYTEFCCTLNGRNECPPGSIMAGWWKADAPGLCGPSAPRYYMDCNASCRGCSCGGSGLCSSSCASCGCGCANGSCGNRKACCTRFRYGNCSNHVACVGPIICRVVTCTPPWQLNGSCERSPRTDNNTRYHNRPCLTPPPPPVIYDHPVVGDWSGSGTSGIGVVRGRQWLLRDTPSGGNATRSFAFGLEDDRPVTGRWAPGGVCGVGVVRGRTWHLRNTPSGGGAQRTIVFGAVGDLPVVGDWDGDGVDGIGVVRGGRHWYLRNTLSTGPAEIEVLFGRPGDVPVVGDWDGDGRTGIGVRRGTTWYLADLPVDPPAGELIHPTSVRTFTFGRSSDLPITGSWDGEAAHEVGVIRGNQWFFDADLSAAAAERQAIFGKSPLKAAGS